MAVHAYRRLFMVYQTLILLMQFSNMKDYSEIKPIASSRFEIGIIYMNRGLFYYAISSPTYLGFLSINEP